MCTCMYLHLPTPLRWKKSYRYETLLMLYRVPGYLLVHLLESWWEGVVKNMADHNIWVVPKLFQTLLNKTQKLPISWLEWYDLIISKHKKDFWLDWIIVWHEHCSQRYITAYTALTTYYHNYAQRSKVTIHCWGMDEWWNKTEKMAQRNVSVFLINGERISWPSQRPVLFAYSTQKQRGKVWSTLNHVNDIYLGRGHQSHVSYPFFILNNKQ